MKRTGDGLKPHLPVTRPFLVLPMKTRKGRVKKGRVTVPLLPVPRPFLLFMEKIFKRTGEKGRVTVPLLPVPNVLSKLKFAQDVIMYLYVNMSLWLVFTK